MTKPTKVADRIADTIDKIDYETHRAIAEPYSSNRDEQGRRHADYCEASGKDAGA